MLLSLEEHTETVLLCRRKGWPLRQVVEAFNNKHPQSSSVSQLAVAKLLKNVEQIMYMPLTFWTSENKQETGK
jgi:hypothetical protein